MRKAVILAGGLGKRLRPFTQAIPKPLLPVGEKAILEVLIQGLVKGGVEEIYIAANYKAAYFQSFVSAREDLGAKIRVSKEDKPLGTCGPLSLLTDQLTEPFVVVNGDILTQIDFGKLFEFGERKSADLSVVTKMTRTPFNFGSVKSKNGFLISVDEKPDLLIEILAGIYYMRPGVFDFIPKNRHFGIPNLINAMLEEKQKIGRYLMHEFWLDIGQMDDFEEAQQAFERHFSEE